MHRRIIRVSLFSALLVLALVMAWAAPRAQAGVSPQFVRDLYDKVSPSLVIVQYTYDGELGRRDIAGEGLVIGEDGLVITSLHLLLPGNFPEKQLTDFKIIIPGDEEKELDAILEGRDERSNLAFFRTKEKQHWPAVKFEEAPVNVGDPVISIGLLPKAAGYHPYVTQPMVCALLRGALPEELVSADALTSVGSPVFNADGKAIGLVNDVNISFLLNNPFKDSRQTPLSVIQNAPRVYVPARDFLASLADPPTAGHPLHYPRIGVAQLSGLTKDTAEHFKLKGQPAVQIGAVIPNGPAEKAGLKAGDIIIEMDGKPLERGDEPDETGEILQRHVLRLKVGTQVRLTVLSGDEDKTRKEVTVTLEERPKLATQAERYFAKDLGFATRDLVFDDLFDNKLPADFKGVIVGFVKPSSAAASAGLEPNDLLTQINGQPVTDVGQFEKLYTDFREKNKKDAVILEVLRNGVNTQVIRIEPPQ